MSKRLEELYCLATHPFFVKLTKNLLKQKNPLGKPRGFQNKIVYFFF